jgi:hypothetical protein
MAGRTLQFQANGARSNGSPLDLGSGDYRARFTIGEKDESTASKNPV